MDHKIVTRSESQAVSSGFIPRVYGWMSLGLIFSAVGSFWLLSQPSLLKLVFTNNFILIGLIVAELGLVFWLSAAAMRMSGAMAATVFLVYSFLNGVTLSSIFLVYTGGSIMTTFAITAGTFFFFSVYGMTTKKDLTTIGSLAYMALIGIILASVVNFFLHSSAMMWIITYVGIAIFLALIAYDTRKLKAMQAMAQDAESEGKLAIVGALVLYLDFINLFLLLLRIFGRSRD